MKHVTLGARRRTLVAGIVGNVMEWYDFSVYGYFAVTIGRNFFPAEDATASLLAAFGVFAAGFLMRPLGSLLFGHIGDKMGRKPALTISVALMAVPTFLIGVLPTHQQIGITASILLLVMRLLQGLSVAGEYTTSSIFMVEQSSAHRRGLIGSFVPVGATIGALLGSAVGAAVTTVLDQHSAATWGWRIPFLLGIAIGVSGLYLRRHMIEDSSVENTSQRAASPIREAFRAEWAMVARLIGLGAVGAVGFYMTFVYITTYLQQVDHVTQSRALIINTISMVVLLLLLIPAGELSDRIGRKPLLLVSTGGTLILAWPLFWMMHHNDFFVILLGQIGFATLGACFWGVFPAVMVELTRRRTRCVVLSLGYNTVMAVLGGLTPVVAVYTVSYSGYDLSPAFPLMIAAALSLVIVLGMRETYQMHSVTAFARNSSRET